jgi:HD-like signal output (HDOD) protein
MEHWNMPAIYRFVAARHHHEGIGKDTGTETVLLAIIRLVNSAIRRHDVNLSTARVETEILELPEAVLLKLTDINLMKLYGILEQSQEVIF